jgi:hypothetical protein
MPTVNDLGESKYLKKEDCEPPVVVTIVSYDNVNVEKEGKPAKMKFTLHFKGVSRQLPLDKDTGQEKPMVLNKTNGNRIAKITGTPDFDGWIGKQIELFHDEMVEFGGELVGGIRARPVTPQGRQIADLPETDGPPTDSSGAGAAAAQDEEIPF